MTRVHKHAIVCSNLTIQLNVEKIAPHYFSPPLPPPPSHSSMHKKIPIPLRKLELSLCIRCFPSFFFFLLFYIIFPSLLIDSFRHSLLLFSFRKTRRWYSRYTVKAREERSEAREKGRYLRRDSTRSLVLSSYNLHLRFTLRVSLSAGVKIIQTKLFEINSILPTEQSLFILQVLFQ